MKLKINGKNVIECLCEHDSDIFVSIVESNFDSSEPRYQFSTLMEGSKPIVIENLSPQAASFFAGLVAGSVLTLGMLLVKSPFLLAKNILPEKRNEPLLLPSTYKKERDSF